MVLIYLTHTYIATSLKTGSYMPLLSSGTEWADSNNNKIST